MQNFLFIFEPTKTPCPLIIVFITNIKASRLTLCITLILSTSSIDSTKARIAVTNLRGKINPAKNKTAI